MCSKSCYIATCYQSSTPQTLSLNKHKIFLPKHRNDKRIHLPRHYLLCRYLWSYISHFDSSFHFYFTAMSCEYLLMKNGIRTNSPTYARRVWYRWIYRHSGLNFYVSFLQKHLNDLIIVYTAFKSFRSVWFLCKPVMFLDHSHVK